MIQARKFVTAGALVALGGSATVLAQDSVGLDAGVFGAIEGDAITTHDVNEQCNQFVLDLGALVSSWDNTWGIGPLSKSSSAEDPMFFNMLMSAQSISRDRGLTDRSNEAYEDWNGSDVVGGIAPGINQPDNSAPPFVVFGPGDGAQLGYAFNEFGGPNNSENENINGGIINWDPLDNPGRLYVTRTQAAQANSDINLAASVDFGLGMVDSDGNISFRGDDFGHTGPDGLVGNNLFRVRVQERDCGAVNWIHRTAAGVTDGSDAMVTDVPLAESAITVTVPNILPESYAASGNGRLIGPDFSAQYRYENPINAMSTGAHLNTATDHRGGLAFTRSQWFAGTVGTAAVLSKPTDNAAYGATNIDNSGGDTVGISFFGIDGTGAVVSTAPPVVLPWATDAGGSITDNAPVSGIDPNTTVAFTTTSAMPPADSSPAEFGHVSGQTAFRGPVSQVMIGEGPTGERLIGAVVYHENLGGSSINPGNILVVGKVNVVDPSLTQWTAAAWNNFDGSTDGTEGKLILDGPSASGGQPIARLVPHEIASLNDLRGLGGGPGPSITPGGFDSEGNIYFVSPIQIKRGQGFDDLDNGASPPDPFDPQGSTTPSEERDRYEFGLIRGNLVSDGNDFYYELELLLATGSEFHGKDTGLDYQVQRLTITNLGGILNSAAFDSGNVTEATNPSGVPQSQSDPLTLGGLIVEADICYDVDGLDTVDPDNPNPSGFSDFPVELGGSGRFEDPSNDDVNGDPLFPDSIDQAYTVILFIGNQPSVLGACCVDDQCVDAVTAAQCADLGGIYQGDDSDCDNVECAASGACCYSCNGGTPVVCQELSLNDCCAAQGIYAGDGTTCASGICANYCQADLDGDGDVDVFDFGIFGPNFNTIAGATRTTGDFDCDGDVDVFDFGVFGPNFNCTGPAGVACP